MKKYVLCLTVALAFYTLSATANATVKTYEFSFTAEDLMSYDIASGADGTTAADNALFDGARLKRNGSSSAAGPLRSYLTSQKTGFKTWADSTTDKFMSFNLWGLDGNGAKWGEDYKPTSWGTTTNPAGWYSWDSSYAASGWGSPPAGVIIDKFIGWGANSYGDGFNFQDTDLVSKQFTFQLDIDSDNAFYGAATNGAPNDLAIPELTFWFGGWFDDDYWGEANDWYMYEGNMVLTGKEVAPVPEPGTLLLLGSGLAGLVLYRRKKMNR